MTDLEKALEAEIEKLKAAISYIEDANERTAQALKAAEEMKAEHEQWRAQDSVTQQAQGQIEALQQRVATLEAREVPERLCTTPSISAELRHLTCLQSRYTLLKCLYFVPALVE